MNASEKRLKERYGSRVDALVSAIERGDEIAFHHTVRRLATEDESGLIDEVGRLTHEMQAALERFHMDPRMQDLAENEVPNARIRLEHVLKMTDEAAHRTMDLVDQACAPAERTGKAAAELAAWSAQSVSQGGHGPEWIQAVDAFLGTAQGDSEHVRRNLSEVLLTQGYQDLTGQIIRGVITLIGEIEQVLAELARLSQGSDDATPVRSVRPVDNSRGFGPQIPTLKQGSAVNGQDDVDSLLSGLGL